MTTATAGINAVDYFQAKLDFEMTPWSLKAHLDKGMKEHLVLDVRSPEDYAQGHIPGAKNVPLAELSKASLPKDKIFVTYCANITCALAPKAALQLAKQGHKVMELFGGIAEWQAKGFPLEK